MDPLIAALSGIEIVPHAMIPIGAWHRVRGLPDQSAWDWRTGLPSLAYHTTRIVMHPDTWREVRAELASLEGYADVWAEVRLRSDERARWADEGGGA
jgi:hypothetical protein